MTRIYNFSVVETATLRIQQSIIFKNNPVKIIESEKNSSI